MEGKVCPTCGGDVPLHKILFDDATVVHAGQSAHLTPQQADLFGLLLEKAPATVSKDRIYRHLYRDVMHAADLPEPDIVDALIYRMRGRLEPLGIAIETRPTIGYRLTADDPKKVREAAELRRAARAGKRAQATPDQAAEIRRLHGKGTKQSVIATLLGLTYRAVNEVVEA